MSAIKIAVRQRPANPQSPLKIFTTSKDQHTVTIRDPKTSENRSFDFYRVFLETASQEEIFDTLGRPLLDQVMDGMNSCFILYGQSNSGKSYSMFGEEEFALDTRGVVYRAMEAAFEEMSKLSTKEFEVSVSFYELYKEQVRDLGLAYKDPKATAGFKDMNLELIDHQTEVYVSGLSHIRILTPEDGASVIRAGWELRRSVEAREGKYAESTHTFFGLQLHQKDKRGDITTLSTSYLLFVILANSDKPGRDSDLSEALSVHKSFTTLSKVISSLGSANPPYRDSKLTRLLQGCLRERLSACLLITINQSPIFFDESLTSLEFADRCLDLTGIVNKGGAMQTDDYQGLAQKDFRIKVLQNELQELKQKQREMEMQQEKQISELQEQLGIKVDIHELLQAQPGSREHTWLVKQKEAVQRIDGLARINQDLEQKISENKKLFEKIKRLESQSQEQHTTEVLKLKDQILNLKEQLEMEKARAQHSARQQLQSRSNELRTMLKHSKALIDEKKTVLQSVPFTMKPQPPSVVNMRELGKSEMKQKYDRMLADQQASHKAHEQAVRAKFEQILNAKEAEASELSQQLNEFRESKKQQVRELREEAVTLYQVIEQQRKVLGNIQSGEYNQHLRAVNFPKELIPPLPSPEQFQLCVLDSLHKTLKNRPKPEPETPKPKSAPRVSSELNVEECVQRLTTLTQDNLDGLKPQDLKQKMGELQEACRCPLRSESEQLISDLRSESDRIGEETVEYERKLQKLMDETNKYKQMYADEVRRKIEDKTLVETQRKVLAQVAAPLKPVIRPLVKPASSKRPTTTSVLEADISLLDTDSIVNSTNSNLTLDIGDAKAIMDRGGVALKTECIKYVNTHGLVDIAQTAVTATGDLACRCVIHVAAPMYVNGRRGEPESLRQAVINVLDAAQQHGCKSIALPAIGTVPYDYPKAECATIMMHACEWYLSTSNGSLELVQLVSTDKYMVRCFNKALGIGIREQGIFDDVESFRKI